MMCDLEPFSEIRSHMVIMAIAIIANYIIS